LLFSTGDRVPRKLQPRLERALLLREQLNQQLYEADKWLRLHVENYDVVPVHSTNAEAPTGGLTSGATRWQANIAAVLIDSDALHIALSSAFGEDDQRRPLSDSDMESMLRGYLSTTEPHPVPVIARGHFEAGAVALKAGADGQPPVGKAVAGGLASRGSLLYGHVADLKMIAAGAGVAPRPAVLLSYATSRAGRRDRTGCCSSVFSQARVPSSE
jgi:hypothetical protein